MATCQVSAAGSAAGSFASNFWSSASTLRSASRSSELFDDAPSVPSPTGMPCARTCAYGKTRPTASLRFETGIGDDGRAVCGDELELGFVHPDAVREDETRREQADPLEVRARAFAGAIDAAA